MSDRLCVGYVSRSIVLEVKIMPSHVSRRKPRPEVMGLGVHDGADKAHLFALPTNLGQAKSSR